MFNLSSLTESLDNLRARHKDMEKYAEIIKKVRTVDLIADTVFQRQFTYFYRLRRNAAWRKSYFKLFAECRGKKKLSFESVLHTLYERTGRVEASFSSKMLATLNPRMPIWDSIVLGKLHLVPPARRNKEKALTEAVHRYDKLCLWYKNFLAGGDAAAVIEQFDAAFPEFKRFSKVKKVDFLLWAGGSPSPFDWNSVVFQVAAVPAQTVSVAVFNMGFTGFAEYRNRNGGGNVKTCEKGGLTHDDSPEV